MSEIVRPFELFSVYYRKKYGINAAVFVLIPNKPISLDSEFYIKGKIEKKKFVMGMRYSPPAEARNYVHGAKEILLEDLQWNPSTKTHWWSNFDDTKISYLVIQKV